MIDFTFEKYKNNLPYGLSTEADNLLRNAKKDLTSLNSVSSIEGSSLSALKLDLSNKIKYLEDQQKSFRDSYNRSTTVIEELFQNDLFEELDIMDNPKREKLYAIAFERGHSCGYSDIYSVASELVELIK